MVASPVARRARAERRRAAKQPAQRQVPAWARADAVADAAAVTVVLGGYCMVRYAK
jgi:hypothetical protein